ncbi:hypothetical protein ACTFIR_007512 [Dictyostelium discoideum]
MRNQDIGKSSEIGSEPEQTPLSSEVKKLSKEKFQKEILAPLKLCGLMMDIEEGSCQKDAVLDRIQLVVPIRELIYSTQQVSGGPISRDIDIILKKEPKELIQERFVQLENQANSRPLFPYETEDFIRSSGFVRGPDEENCRDRL